MVMGYRHGHGFSTRTCHVDGEEPHTQEHHDQRRDEEDVVDDRSPFVDLGLVLALDRVQVGLLALHREGANRPELAYHLVGARDHVLAHLRQVNA